MVNQWRFVMGTFLVLGSLLLVGAAIGSSQRSETILPQDSATSGKIASWVLEHTADGKEAEFIVVLADQASLAPASALTTKAERGRFVRDTLWQKSQQTQAPIIGWLEAHNVEYRSFYIVNALWVKGSRETAEALAARADVARVEGNPRVPHVVQAAAVESATQPNEPVTVEPGISYTHAPQVWAEGHTGQGIVIGGADTGIRWTHHALKSHYRGWNGTTASHDYNWHDSIHSGGGVCGHNTSAPCDDDGHGTNTIGVAVGDDGQGNQIGMAPGAKWIGCRNMNQGVGTPASYMECMEFFLAPYPVNGNPSQGDPNKAPDVTVNSWICPSSEGCSISTLRAAVEAQRAAGLMMVAAAGNDGSNCSSLFDPPAIYAASYTVGALTTGTDVAAPSSSRGPVTVDGSNRIKPDIMAPGVNIRTCAGSSDTGYLTNSGTSLSTPFIAGAVALLWSARPALKNNIDATTAALDESAVHISSTVCDNGVQHTPNNTYGYGRIDILAGVNESTPSDPTRPDFNRDGHPDYLLSATLQTAVWYMDNNAFLSVEHGHNIPNGWQLIDANDVDRDNQLDYIFFNPGTRETAIWYLSGLSVRTSKHGPRLPGNWTLVAARDFNGDNKPDFVLYDSSTRQTGIWYLDDNRFVGSAYGPTLPVAWNLIATEDFNRDGNPDYLLYRPSSHQSAIWYLSGAHYAGGVFGPTVAGGYQLTGAADFDSDNRFDYLLYSPTSRRTAIWYLNINAFVNSAYGPTLPAGWNLVTP